jgi:cold shock CspA family protein
MELGIVKWFNDAKDYGFILSDKDGSSILAEKRDIKSDPQVLFELQQVSFERIETEEGSKAININVLSSVIEHKHLDMPRISVFDNLLPVEVCNSIIERHSRNGMNPNSGKQSRQESFQQVTELVENRGISLGVDPYHYDILATAIVNSAKIPYSHIEAIDIYNYPVGNYLDLHHDYPYDPKQINYYRYGGDRVGTGIFFLNDDFVGGQTAFPKLNVEILPKTGSFLYFEQGYDEATNWSTIHESRPITQGCKWIASCFFSDQPRVGYKVRDFDR